MTDQETIIYNFMESRIAHHREMARDWERLLSLLRDAPTEAPVNERVNFGAHRVDNSLVCGQMLSVATICLQPHALTVD